MRTCSSIAMAELHILSHQGLVILLLHLPHYIKNVRFTLQFCILILNFLSLFLIGHLGHCHLPLIDFRIPSPFPLKSISSPPDCVGEFDQRRFPPVFIRCISSLAKSLLMSSCSPQMLISQFIALPCPPFSCKIMHSKWMNE